VNVNVDVNVFIIRACESNQRCGWCLKHCTQIKLGLELVQLMGLLQYLLLLILHLK